MKARELATSYGDSVWPGFSEAPFGILLVEKDRERLFCHKRVPTGFDSTEVDPVLSCPSGTRPASFPPGMFASFPAVEGVPTIVAGTPEATSRSPEAWILTILHEHFHQMQYAWPDYYPGTVALGLSGNDDSAMWMLNYPFPYDNDETVDAFDRMRQLLILALDSRKTDAFDRAVADYWTAREAARRTVSEDDWRYMELQLWQEGVARWTEGAIASLSGDFSSAAKEADARILRELETLNLATNKREVVYSLGAGEAALLEAAETDWRSRYWSEPFSLGSHFEMLLTDRQEISASR